MVVAIRIDRVEAAKYSPLEQKEMRKTLNKVEAEAEGWFDDPPYAVAEQVFEADDQEVCMATSD